MYAIVDIAGKQYKVSKGDKINTATLDSKPGSKVTFENVLATDDGKKTTFGNPFVKNTTVTAKILEHSRTKKLLVYKKKRRKGYENKNTHRQGFSILEIEKITTKKPAAKKAKAKSKPKAKTTAKKSVAKKTTKTKEEN
ncbi:MAG: 50S ribosomal protein L21 [Candidatus Marinimicrobia bacterium]|jgi:large subunit ribosomal protein L21|nr:50S ribosomal protein L21 [Candidatus Neomarinimicrobiota bacterium]|tara:strand:+ start:295 stop:711 length:417 start_codon:yes stop_codon:yes gene_type:complete